MAAQIKQKMMKILVSSSSSSPPPRAPSAVYTYVVHLYLFLHLCVQRILASFNNPKTLDFGREGFIVSSRNSLSNELQSRVDDFSGCSVSEICDLVLNRLNNFLVVAKELQSGVGQLSNEGLKSDQMNREIFAANFFALV